MPPVPKRPHYFQSQFLVVRDFQDEQAYHEESLRRHNRLLHEWGVIREGLQVSKSAADFVISPGSAIDSLGREIILEKSRTLSAADVQAARQTAGQEVFVTIEFQEGNSKDAEDKYPAPGGTENVTRKVPSPLIVATKTPASDGTVVILARIAADGSLPAYARKLASSFIPRGTNLGDISLDGALSFTSKTSPIPQVGLDYDPATDQLRIRARSTNAAALDTTHLTIKRDTGNVVIGTTDPPPGFRLEVAGALKLTKTAVVTSDHTAAYFWNQAEVGATIGGHGFEVQTSAGISLRINSKGNVGIGTTVPATKLHIAGSGTGMPEKSGANQSAGHLIRLRGPQNTPVLDIGGAAEKGFWQQSTDLNDLSKNYPLLLNPNGGNVGIGTTEPATKLHVAGSGSNFPATTGKAQSAGHVSRLAGSSSSVLDFGSAGDKGFWLQSTDLGDLTKNYNLLLNPNGGNVGIGTKEILARLHVAGVGNSLPAIMATTLSSGPVVKLKGNTDSVLDITAASDKGFGLQSTEVDKPAVPHPLLLNPSGGEIGIGTKTPRFALHIRKDKQSGLGPTLALMNGAGHEFAQVAIDLFTYWNSEPQQLPSGRIVCEDNAGGSGHLIFQTLDTSTTDKKMAERMRIDAASGEVKVKGSISCGGKIAMKSTQWNRYISARAENEGWNVRTHHESLDYEHFTLELASSREFKENISDITALEAMTTLQNLTPVKYDYKGDKAFRPNLGFIAEDMPDNLCSEDRKSISPFEVVPILTRVAKEQQRVIAELQETVRALQKDGSG